MWYWSTEQKLKKIAGKQQLQIQRLPFFRWVTSYYSDQSVFIFLVSYLWIKTALSPLTSVEAQSDALISLLSMI